MLRRFYNKFLNRFTNDFFKAHQSVIQRTDPVAQTHLKLFYRQLLAGGMQLPELKEVGWKAYSQTDEDGKLHFLFSVLGTTNKKCVEICAGDGTECNTINLLLHDGWTGLLVDGNEGNVENGKKWTNQHRNTYVFPPVFVCEWVTRDNINKLFIDNDFSGEIDLLSIDVDGVDYWLWKALTAANPRVVIIEYQQHLGPDRSWTVPYADDFSAWKYPLTDGWIPNFAGASLRALTKLANEKGYRLVGSNTLCFNAIFVRNDVGLNLIPEVSVESCFNHPRAQKSMKTRFPVVAELGWEEV